MQEALRRGEGTSFEKHVLQLKNKTVALRIAKFGDETIAEVAEAGDADDYRMDDEIKRWVEPILKGRGPVVLCEGNHRVLHWG